MTAYESEKEKIFYESEGILNSLKSTSRKLLGNWHATFSFIILLAIIFSALFAPWLMNHDPNFGDLLERLQPPSMMHLLGTDEQGRDMLTRIVYGGRIAMMVGGLSLLVGLFIGGSMGLVSGYFGGWVDHLIMRITDILLAFPYLLLVIAIVSMLGPSLMNAIIAIGVRMIPEFARLVRSVVLSIRSKEYVLATRAVGASNLRIIFHHVLPNCTAPMIVQSTLLMAGAILAESTLSFLGLGTQPPDPSWGTMVSRGREYLITYPHLSLFPGLAIVIVVYALNVFGDWVRDVLDPHTEWTKPPQV
jgi:peptide/nickel transport system permease protein